MLTAGHPAGTAGTVAAVVAVYFRDRVASAVGLPRRFRHRE
ncbi:hypothetical protein [Salinigranum marinum]|nr:hypothetical protein [Salinigranum marinum]